MKRFSLNNNKPQLIALPPVNKKDNEMSWIQEIINEVYTEYYQTPEEKITEAMICLFDEK